MNEPTFFQEIEQIDRLIGLQEPTFDAIKAIFEARSNQVKFNYIFRNLNSAAWLIPLRKEKIFSVSIAYQSTQIGWPQGEYLARISDVAPKEVAEIFFENEINSSDYYYSLIEAAKKFSIDDMIQAANILLKPSVVNVGHRYDPLVSRIGDMSAQIMISNKEAGFSILEKLLTLDSKKDEFSVSKNRKITVPKIDSWRYKEVLKTIVPLFVDVYPKETVFFLIKLVSQSLELGNNTSKPNDFSKIWFKHIADSSENRDYTIEISIIATLVKTAVEVSSTTSDSELIEYLLSGEWVVFRRLGIYLLSKKPEKLPEIVNKTFLNQELSENYIYETEMTDLFNSAFNILENDFKRSKVAEFLAGPPVDYLYDDPSAPTIEEKEYAELRSAVWTFKRLEGVEKFLTQYELVEFNKVKNIVLHNRSIRSSPPEGGWIGPISSYEKDELKKLNPDLLIALLSKEAKIHRKPWEASSEGLARTLGELIKESPEIGRELLNRSAFLPEVYVQHIFSGFKEAREKLDDDFIVYSLKLALIHIAAPETSRGTAQSIAWYFEAILRQRKPIFLVAQNQQHIMKLLRSLLENPDPTLEREEQYGGDNMDYYTLAINSVRPTALECVIEYALCIHENRNSNSSEHGLNNELKELLEVHLDDGKEKSLAVRSVFGRYLPWLILIDKKWVETQLQSLFPRGTEKRSFLLSPLETYFSYCPVYDASFQSLREIYEFAMEIIDQEWSSHSYSKNAKEHLGQHVLVQFLRGKIDLNDNLLSLFWQNASVEVRRRGLAFIGRTLSTSKEDIKISLLERAIELFEFRLSMATTDEDLSELEGFAWLFAIHKLDGKRKIQLLVRMLEKKVNLSPPSYIVKELDRLYAEFSSEVLTALSLLVEDLEQSDLYHDRSSIGKILGYVNVNSGQSLVNKRVIIANMLGAKGFLEFKEFAIP